MHLHWAQIFLQLYGDCGNVSLKSCESFCFSLLGRDLCIYLPKQVFTYMFVKFWKAKWGQNSWADSERRNFLTSVILREIRGGSSERTASLFFRIVQPYINTVSSLETADPIFCKWLGRPCISSVPQDLIRYFSFSVWKMQVFTKPCCRPLSWNGCHDWGSGDGVAE